MGTTESLPLQWFDRSSPPAPGGRHLEANVCPGSWGKKCSNRASTRKHRCCDVELVLEGKNGDTKGKSCGCGGASASWLGAPNPGLTSGRLFKPTPGASERVGGSTFRKALISPLPNTGQKLRRQFFYLPGDVRNGGTENRGIRIPALWYGVT